jgi:hypothetical protein
MADIKIKDLRPAGSDFFADNESYLSELSEDELSIMGGQQVASLSLFIDQLNLAIKSLFLSLSLIP